MQRQLRLRTSSERPDIRLRLRVQEACTWRLRGRPSATLTAEQATQEADVLGGETFYDLLGVAPTADVKTVRRAYLGLIKECHPDRSNFEANEFCALLNDIYEGSTPRTGPVISPHFGQGPRNWAEGLAPVILGYPSARTFLSYHKPNSRLRYQLWESQARELQKFCTLAGVHLLHDMMQPLEQLSMLLQSDALEPHMLASHVAIVKAALEQLFIRSSSAACTSFVRMRRTLSSAGAWVVNGQSFRSLAQVVLGELDQRIPSSQSLVPRSCVGMVAAELVADGQQELQELVKHFCNASQRQQLFRVEGTAGVARLVHQLTLFKREMWRVFQANRSVTLQSAWVLLMELGYVHFPLMMQLTQVMLLMPLQTAVVERGFSIHRIIMHRLANRLKLATVDSLMRIRIIGPSKHSYQKEEAMIAHAASAMDEILKLQAAGKPEGILAALSEAALPLEAEQPNVPLDLEGDTEEVESLWGKRVSKKSASMSWVMKWMRPCLAQRQLVSRRTPWKPLC
ncbi:uncharacterized protein HaLaN_16704 [Haematococcus lacustris]|uniref:J domain-containing protein n=1 Tax=Haematococcus lacustris TaxID=44745 RepID=A0A699ZAM2_HAELA|nr:uncharacterized protein HaLaN_16704 [Haematococcus lacustris]